MKGSTHILGGVTMAISLTAMAGIYLPEVSHATIEWSSVGSFCLYISGASTGSVLPDIEKKGSTISNKHKFISLLSRCICSHRGITHSLLALCVVGALLFPFALLIPSGYGYAYMTGVLIGYGSHLLLDSLNPTGVPFFYPFSETKFSFAKIKTGGFVEWLFSILLGILLFMICRFSLYDKLLALNLPEQATNIVNTAKQHLPGLSW